MASGIWASLRIDLYNPPMYAELGRITVFCFAASYAVGLALEVLRLFQARPALRWLALGFTSAGLIAHSIYVAVNPLPLQTAFGSLIFLAWILAVFCVYGAVHHSRLAWELFVLPVVLGLVLLSQVFPDGTPHEHVGPTWRAAGLRRPALLARAARRADAAGRGRRLRRLCGQRHVSGAAASPQNQATAGPGSAMLSLERLESMNRRAIVLAFPLLTAGLLVAVGSDAEAARQLARAGRTRRSSARRLCGSSSPFCCYLRYGIHAGGRQVAWLTIVAFGLLLLALVAGSPLHAGGARHDALLAVGMQLPRHAGGRARTAGLRRRQA